MSRRLVPTALRNELTEYSSLLRALRTTQTLDVAARLTEPQEPSQPETTASTSTDATSRKRRRSSPDPHSQRWRKRDQWTRWPIPAKDVPLPEWSLQDELATIVKQVLAPVDSESGEDVIVKREQDTESEQDSDGDGEDAYIEGLAGLLTPVIEDVLESLFALICAHTVARPDSMQNRIEPFDWHDLVNILASPAAAHLVDETILQNVIARMPALCETTPASASTAIPPPSPDLALHRHRLVKTSRSRLNTLLSKHTTSLFEQTLPPPNYKYLSLDQIPIKKKRKRKKKSSISEGETSDVISRSDKKGKKKDTLYTEEKARRGPDWEESDDEG